MLSNTILFLLLSSINLFSKPVVVVSHFVDLTVVFHNVSHINNMTVINLYVSPLIEFVPSNESFVNPSFGSDVDFLFSPVSR